MLALVMLALVVPAAVGPDDGLMPYPFMGWNAWAVFNTQQKTSEAVIRESADALVQSGLLEAGYDSLGWGEPGFVRDSAGQLGPRFRRCRRRSLRREEETTEADAGGKKAKKKKKKKKAKGEEEADDD